MRNLPCKKARKWAFESGSQCGNLVLRNYFRADSASNRPDFYPTYRSLVYILHLPAGNHQTFFSFHDFACMSSYVCSDGGDGAVHWMNTHLVRQQFLVSLAGFGNVYLLFLYGSHGGSNRLLFTIRLKFRPYFQVISARKFRCLIHS